MRKFFYIFVLIFLGCAQTSNVITLPEYQSDANQVVSNYNVFIAGVEDNRVKQDKIGIIYADNSTISDEYTLSNNLNYYFMQAISKELRVMGANVTDKKLDNSIIVNIDITKLDAQIKGYTGSNLTGSGEIKITIQKGKKTYVKRVAETQSKFALRDKDSIANMLKSIIDTLVQKGASQIINLN